MSSQVSYRIHSEPSAGHWVAWATSGTDDKPAGAVVLVGQTQAEAEANAQHWVDRLIADPALRRE